jgi:hypothetical protein
MLRFKNWLVVCAVFVLSPWLYAESLEFTVVLKNHTFHPSEISVPANTKFLLIVDNQDDTPEEFESHEMHREKVIAGNKTAKIRIGPLKPGRYPFFGEFNEDTAQGVVVAQ